MLNLFTVDLEDWYCTKVIGRVIPRNEWDRCESRIQIGTMRLLDLLEKYNVKGTFFVLGYIAEREPGLIRAIAQKGHEIATHGFFHRPLTQLTHHEFRQDLELSIQTIEGIIRRPVLGHRAPDFSITEQNKGWVFSVLRDCGIVYDSSVFPAWWRHPLNGVSSPSPSVGSSGLLSTQHCSNNIIEVPISCTSFLGIPFPATGGAYFRHAPLRVTHHLMEQCNRQGEPVIFYVHPWELDPDQPRLQLPLLQSIRHYRGIETMEQKIDQLLAAFSFISVQDMLRRKDGGESGTEYQ